MRLTVRTWMALAGLVALMLGGLAEGARRRERFLRRSMECSRISTDLYLRGHFAGRSTGFGPTPAEARMGQEYERRSAHYLKLKEKYSRAARYPWMPVETDPAEPD